ncbi:Ca-activated chloride channel family protein [Thiogranum longum]|uniref:Ca-activated chloride channel family protein n=1 Tax=Thiogranum longum TaxID=1537524 RepID=A0A4R1HBB0_9GAMM|nr:VWA domain-containing protein [Thiogranum longum]TCK17891.1 Ca-activated chloride channel family protein [Thiogranum longum]
MSIEFIWPWVFAALPLPLLMAWLLPRAAENTGAALRLPFYQALTASSVVRQSTPSRIRLWLAILVWALLVIAAARPQYLGEPVHLPISGRDLLLAVDISGSMETEDMVMGGRVTSRLIAVKRVASDFIERRKGDRIGLILFGDQAYLQTPLTFDRKTVNTQLLEAAIGLAGKRTAIGDAIGLAIKRLREQPEGNRVLILLTDGANTAGSIAPLKAADIAAQEGVKIYTIGVGADEMVVQGLFGRQRIANTELDEATLKAIADKTGGRYFRARDLQGLEQVYRLLDKLEPASQDEEVFRPRHELYIWPLAAALLISLLMVLGQLNLLQRLKPVGVPHA